MSQPLAVTRDAVFAAIGRRVFRLPLTDEMFAGYEAPLFFEPVQSKLIIEADEVTVLKHKRLGGKPPFQFKLDSDLDDVLSIDAATGDVTIDGKSASDAALRNLFGIDPETHSLIDGDSGRPRFLREYSRIPGPEAVTDAFKEIAGRASVGIPVSVPVRISVEDDRIDFGCLDYVVTFELDRTVIDKVAESLKETEE